MNSTDLFFIVLSAATAGSLLAAAVVYSVVRYSKRELAGDEFGKGSARDLFLIIAALVVIAFGMWQAGIFG
jgi:hypothetical protein